MQKKLFLLSTFFTILLHEITITYAGNQSVVSFVRVYSGNPSTIREIFIPEPNHYFILTNKIFMWNDTIWEKPDLTVKQDINLFFPIAKDDYWFTVNTELNTSDLYRFYQNRLEKIRSPFSNEILAIHFENKNFGIFAGWGELSVFENNEFIKITPPLASRGITKVYGRNKNCIWLLSDAGELFLFKNKLYERILSGIRVKDFFISDNGVGIVLTESGIYQTGDHQPVKIIENELISKANKIVSIDQINIWAIGDSGLILNIYNGVMKKIGLRMNENLRDLAVTKENEIWIGGDRGLILYSGKKHFPPCPEDVAGFTKVDLYEYGGYADDEYGVVIADFNSDNKNDIYTVCIFNQDRMYINYMDSDRKDLMSPGFKDEAVNRGATGFTKNLKLAKTSELHLGVAAADIDNDGDQDIYLCSLNGKNKLLLNNGKGYFRDVSDQKDRACEDLKRSNTAAFADVDNDGDLDLFVTSEHASNKLYLNDGTGHFKDVTASAGLASTKGGMCASFADINNDGLPDLCVSFWFSGNKIYRNESHGRTFKFRDITSQTDLARAEPSKSNAVAFADINNDGNTDLCITSRNSPNKIYLNDGRGIFRDVTRKYLPDKILLCNGAVFADFDLDGYQDLYLSNVGENIFYKSIGGTSFIDATELFGVEQNGYSTGCSVGDLDNDGDPDLYVANYIDGNSSLFINNKEEKNAVTFILHGTKSNRDAIGAKVILYSVDPSSGVTRIKGYREINGGSGYGSASAKESIFGISHHEKYAATVIFPAFGKRIEIPEVHPGDRIHIDEEIRFEGTVSLALKAIKRFFIDNETQIESFKFLVIIILISLSIYFQRTRAVIPFKTLIFIYSFIILLFLVANRALVYETFAISFSIQAGVVITSLLMLHMLSERILLKRNAQREKQEVRESISRDLHDDLASTLGSISIYGNMLKKFGSTQALNHQEISGKIAELSQSALQSITDIIWITTPKHDSLKSLLSKTRNYYFELFHDNNIRFSAEIEMTGDDIVLSDKSRHNIFLILKEIANNIIRHSKADRVGLRANISGGKCIIEVSDNGCGFDPEILRENNNQGNGLTNIRRRAIESAIQLTINTVDGVGTSIIMNFKIAQSGH